MDDSPSTGATASPRDEIAALRERFALIDDIDLRTAEMVERLAAVIQSSAEPRARASLEIGTRLQALERLLEEDRERQRALMLSLRADLAAAHQRMLEVVRSLAALGSQVSGLQARVAGSTEPAEPANAWDAASAPSPAPLPSARTWAVIVDGISTPAQALALQRHLAALPGVVAASTRAFDGGSAEVEVRARRGPARDDLLAWTDIPTRVLAMTEVELRGEVLTARDYGMRAGSS